MKNTILFTALIVLISFFSTTTSAENQLLCHNSASNNKSESAKITFKNHSDYTMSIKVIRQYGGLHSYITIGPYRSQVVKFSSTSSYKLKIKAVLDGRTSYHDGGDFSVTCTPFEWTEGEMTFKLSSHGSGLGPKISAREFESNN